jgi:hypothetical protein
MEMNEFITKWRRRFLIATALLIILLSGFVLLDKVESNDHLTVRNFQIIRGKLALMRTSTSDIRQTLVILRGFLPPGYNEKSIEALLFSRVDDLKTMFPLSLFTISAPEESTDNMVLPFTISVGAYNYSSFLNDIGMMQTKSFPFVTIRSISICTEEGTGGGLTYKIEGVISTPKKNGSP